ncbi:MAG: hypothetical protein ACR2P5_01025 [Gammaproteobacteria bacterium]
MSTAAFLEVTIFPPRTEHEKVAFSFIPKSCNPSMSGNSFAISAPAGSNFLIKAAPFPTLPVIIYAHPQS